METFLNNLSHKIIGESIYVHKQLGQGLLESAYQNCLYHRLKQLCIFVEKEKPLPVVFDGLKFDCGYRLDLVVENSILIELISIKRIKNIHLAQMITYLKLGGYDLGLLINFNVGILVDGLKRARV